MTAFDAPPHDAPHDLVLPADDPFLAAGGYDLADLAGHWAAAGARQPMSAEEMRGADRRAQRQGVPLELLMEQAGAAVAAAARALIEQTSRAGHGPVLVLAGAGNNGGDGSVAARYLGRAGVRCVVVLVATEERPTTRDAGRNWDRLEQEPGVSRFQAAGARDLGMLGAGVEKASIVVDALL
nr:hypothetical protein [Chloroflexota bacterium]